MFKRENSKFPPDCNTPGGRLISNIIWKEFIPNSRHSAISNTVMWLPWLANQNAFRNNGDPKETHACSATSNTDYSAFRLIGRFHNALQSFNCKLKDIIIIVVLIMKQDKETRRSPRRSTKCNHTEPICDFPHVYLYKKKSSISKFPTTNSAYRCVSFILFHSVCGFSYVRIQSKPHKYTSYSIDLNCLRIGTKDRKNNSEQAAIQEAETLQQLILNDTGNVCTIRSVHERTCQSVLMKEGEKLPQKRRETSNYSKTAEIVRQKRKNSILQRIRLNFVMNL